MDKIKCEAFLSAAEGGSMTYAANLLGYTQPGITRMIDSLERLIAILSVLWERGKRPCLNLRYDSRCPTAGRLLAYDLPLGEEYRSYNRNILTEASVEGMKL